MIKTVIGLSKYRSLIMLYAHYVVLVDASETFCQKSPLDTLVMSSPSILLGLSGFPT